MMDDNTPQLGGLPEDNAPMISGRGTQIIADARGAYLAGNLDALIKSMDSAQQESFRRVMLRHAIDDVLPILDAIPDADLPYLELREAVREVQARLRASEADLAGLAPADLDLEAFDYYQAVAGRGAPAFFILIALMGHRFSNQTAEKWLYDAIAAAHPPPTHPQEAGVFYAAARSLIRQWQLDAAWAVLHGGEVLPVPRLDAEQLRAFLMDSPARYREGRLDALLYVMPERSQAQFRAVMLTHAVEHLERTLHSEPRRKQERRWLDVFKRWISQPHDPEPEEWQRLKDEMAAGVNWRAQALRTLVEVFNGGEGQQGAASRLAAGSEHAAGAVGHATATLADIGKGRQAAQLASEVKAKVARWHLEVAWALLNEQPLPPPSELGGTGE